MTLDKNILTKKKIKIVIQTRIESYVGKMSLLLIVDSRNHTSVEITKQI